MNISQDILNAPTIPRKKYFQSLQPMESLQFIGNYEGIDVENCLFEVESDVETSNFWRRSLFSSENSILNVMISYNNGGFMSFHEEFERRSLCRRG